MRNVLEGRFDAKMSRYFLQVLESGSVRGAADALGINPSVMSRAIGLLEQECATRLLERHGRGVRPTDAGALVAEYLRHQYRQKQQLLEQLEGIRKVQRGHVDIISGGGFVDWLMIHILAPFMARYPAITMDLSEGRADDIARHVLEDRAHVGILAFHLPDDGRLRVHHSYPYPPIQALVHESHPLAQLRPPLALADLLPYRGVAMQRGFGLQQQVEAAQQAEGVRLNTAFTTSSFMAMSHFVRLGLGYVLSSRLLTTPQQQSQVVKLPLKNPILSQGQVYVISRQGRVLSPAVTILLRDIVGGLDNYASA